ncbi:hypothetical protein VMCG_10064 [Cytospora schulzeri]|uniref:Uncharacterized protein n=1 Tax=Cytospora schulzeri TaxID=448051 RepID=A0A423VCP8_9PEZI|nr:hypothetical protein VMCG_10064 [Valsa malicola]
MSYWTPPMYCMGCHQSVCHGDCLAKHRDRYSCHNPQCVYHAPSPQRPDPGSEPAEENGPGAAATPATTTTTTEITENNHFQDGNFVFRETITREWRLVNGQLIQVPEQRVTVTPQGTTTTSQAGPGQNDTATPNTNATGATGVNLNDNITEEEIEAQARLWAQFQPPQRGNHPHRLDVLFLYKHGANARYSQEGVCSDRHTWEMLCSTDKHSSTADTIETDEQGPLKRPGG